MIVIILLLKRGFIALNHSVAADERSEAASGGKAVVNTEHGFFQEDLILRIYDRFAIGRSLATLVSCYASFC
ncbi:hypothetical protein TU76_03360 [Pseudomonas psychrophila]|nr:hypothetical protein TU76_03360 [Pseudomonas psychrophila]